MSRVVFLVEDLSMMVLLDGVLPRFFPGLSFRCLPHEGKQDLDRSIRRTLRNWREPGVRFVVVRDNDRANCHALKKKLVDLCRAQHRDALVRIACQELEAWYLGDPVALANAFGHARLRSLGSKVRFRDPDAIVQPARALEKLIPEFQKVSGARRMASRLSRGSNSSRSFQVFVEGVERLARAAGWAPGAEGHN